MHPAILFAALLAFVIVDACAQGGIARRNRLYVPPLEQSAVNLDLHMLCPLLLVVVLGLCWAWQGWQWPVVGVLLRTALMDPIINYRLGESPFHLGSSAWTDKALRKVGGPLASAVLRVAALGSAMWITFFKSVG